MYLESKTKGFTLIELLLVMVILVVLAGMVAPRIIKQAGQAKRDAVKVEIDGNLALALDIFALHNDRYPNTDEGLQALITKPSGLDRWQGPYLKKMRTPRDPWGHLYIYVSPGTNNPDYDLSSYGPDGVESDDDITNWEEAVPGEE